MKFFKANLILIICGAAVLLAVVALYYPIGAQARRLRQRMSSELRLAQRAASLESSSIHIPGEKPFVGPVTPAIIKVKKEVQRHIAAQAKRLRRLVERFNAAGRVKLPASPKGKVIPLLAGAPQPHLLPHPSPSYYVRGNFRRAYRRLFVNNPRDRRAWLTQLRAGAPPAPRRISRILREKLRRQARLMPRNATGGIHASRYAGRRKRRLLDNLTRQMVFHAAAKCRIYADPASFQERQFVQSSSEPTADQIYEAFVDTWLQGDVVKAIAALNKGSANVGQSPVKRLIHITVGAAAAAATGATPASRFARPVLVGDGGLFIRGAAGAAPSAMSAGMPGAGSPPGRFGVYAPAQSSAFSSSPGVSEAGGAILTGHLTNPRYQVTLMNISLVIEPWQINRFIDQLYRLNNGYTVLQIQMHTVDPIDALTSGYVYGKVPVVRADILVEAIFFTSWNGKIMPADYCAKCGVPAPAP